ncbi:hypothetical protein Cgig2_001910 [Carnegiea gigantea]|uniref:peroxidase n=1 Tax=Carnegiea gigantea TaxID=171969 RepID=A0A9Q1QDI0_9CARY|nr:hypothetical protein Cgig2_001910 [Carnegiea gigantea]
MQHRVEETGTTWDDVATKEIVAITYIALKLIHVCAFFSILSLFSHASYAQLFVNFCPLSCPSLESIRKQAINKEASMGKKAASPNVNNFAKGFKVIDTITTSIEDSCCITVSHAYVLILAVRDIVLLDPHGRDAIITNLKAADNNHSTIFFNLAYSIDYFFKNQSLTNKEMMTLCEVNIIARLDSRNGGKNNDAFLKDFVAAVTKMGSISSHTSTNGEIRMNYQMIDSNYLITTHKHKRCKQGIEILHSIIVFQGNRSFLLMLNFCIIFSFLFSIV